MLHALESLSEDPVELRAVSELLMAEVQSLTYQDEKLKAELHGHRKARSGSRSESMDQPAFDLQKDEEIEAAANEQKNEAGSNGTDVDETDKPARRKHSRNPLPDHLDRQECCRRVRTALTAVGACARSVRTLPRNWNMSRAALWYAGFSAPAWPAPVVKPLPRPHCRRAHRTWPPRSGSAGPRPDWQILRSPAA